MIALVLMLVTDPSSAPTPTPRFDMVVSGDRSNIRFTLEHKLHTVEGLANAELSGGAIFDENNAQVHIRVPVKNFDTGHKKRDETMREVIEAERFAFVELNGTLTDAKASGAKKFVGHILFHGVSRALNATVTLRNSGKEVVATCKFKISLDAHGIKRPSLMFVKVNDSLLVEAEVVFRRPG